MKRVDAQGRTHISALGWVFTVAMITLTLAVIGVVVNLILLVSVRSLVDDSKDQSEQNQQHIDCIVALGHPDIPEFCIEVRDQLLRDGIVTQEQLDASYVRNAAATSTTSVPIQAPTTED